jgi:hypothetical protein
MLNRRSMKQLLSRPFLVSAVHRRRSLRQWRKPHDRQVPYCRTGLTRAMVLPMT